MLRVSLRSAAFLTVLSCLPFAGTSVSAQEIAAKAERTCYVNKFKFDNEGAYELRDFKVGNHDYWSVLSPGQSKSWQLKNANIDPGTEVWLTYRLDQGDAFKKMSCQKDSTTLVYHPNGNTWKLWSRGSTKFNKRCRFRSNNTCITSVD